MTALSRAVLLVGVGVAVLVLAADWGRGSRLLHIADSAASDSAAADSARDNAVNPVRSAAIRDSIATLLSDFTAKMNVKDMEGVGKLYSNDSSFYWVEGGLLQYRHADDVREALLTLRSIPEIKLAYFETHIDVLAPTVATVRTEFSQTFMRGVGNGDTYGGYITMTVVREPDGWKLRNGHTSSVKPRP